MFGECLYTREFQEIRERPKPVLAYNVGWLDGDFQDQFTLD
jgi:hypothetical protein